MNPATAPAIFLIATRLASDVELQSVLDSYRTSEDIPGVAAVVTYQDKVYFSGASGVADIETSRRMTPDTVLYAGSLSKILTAIVALRLIDDGKLSLDDPVADIAPATQRADSVHVSHLLAHTSGLHREGDFNYWFTAKFPDQSALAKYLKTTPLRFTPGTRTSYSNIGYATLGLVIERSSELSYGAALDHYVLAPLHMSRSGTEKPGATLSRGYSPIDQVLPDNERPFAGLGERIGKRRIREYHDARAMTPAFGVYMSTRDLSTIGQVLLGYGGDEILSEAMRQKITTDQGSGRGFGMRPGKHNGRRVARHGGWFAAHRTHLLLDLESGISVSVMTNSDSATPDAIAEGLLDAMIQSASD